MKRRYVRSALAAFCGVAALSLAGCGGEARTAVEGKITYKGQPVTSGLINFQLNRGEVFGGSIESDGTYHFEMPPGEYQVRIDAPAPMAAYIEGQPEPKPGPRLAPAKYANYATSDLKTTVGSDSPQTVDFPLE